MENSISEKLMELQKSDLFIAFLCLIIIVGISGCAKKKPENPEKENLIAYNNAIADWIEAPDFISKLTKFVKHENDLDGYLDYGMLKIARRHGYKSIDEPVKLFKKYAKDREVTEAMKDAEKRTAAVLHQIELFKIRLANRSFSSISKIIDADDLRIRRDMARDDGDLLLESEAEEAKIEGISADSLKDIPLLPDSMQVADSVLKK